MGAKIYDLAVEMNKKGDYFPIWGTCLGLEFLTFMAANKQEHRSDCDSYNDALPLDFTPDFHKSKLFGNAPDEILNILSSQRHRIFPFYGVIFHPEKNAFEWKRKKNHPHFAEAIITSQFFAEFFVNEARKNDHTFSSQLEEVASLIYNYPVTYTVAKVCERWSSLVQDESLWKSLNFVCNKNMSTEYICYVLEQAPLLQSLTLQWRTDTHIIFEQLCNNRCIIRQLNLVCCGQIKVAEIEALTNHLRDLESFSLGKCWAIESNCINLVCKFSNLKSLNLSHNPTLNGHILNEIINSCHLLQHINIDYVRGLSDEDIIYLLESKKNNLLSLTLYGENLTDSSFCCMARCNVLRTLHLSSCLLMTDKGLRALSKLNSLKSFKLRLAKLVSTEGLSKFLLSAVAFNLDYLILSRLPNLTDGAAHIVPLNCVHLKYLEIVYCPSVTDISREHIISSCKLLKVFHFRQNSTGDISNE
ncbi:hypothetical protein C0J52_24835 [Blattella germanica]|nr:hypothetical protein C0J52_24835 [Blattella germanica]